MAAEEVVVVSSDEDTNMSLVLSSDNKRKFEDLEPELAVAAPSLDQLKGNSNDEPDAAEIPQAELVDGEGDFPDVKRPRLDDKPEGLAITTAENGHQDEELVDESSKENVELPPTTMENSQSEDAEPLLKEVQETVEQPTADSQTGSAPQTAIENSLKNGGQEPSTEETQLPSAEIPQQEEVYSAQQQEPTSEDEPMSRRIEVPNNKVGVLIGKAGDTIRYLQYNSGAKIQIMRDADANPHSVTRPVELIGSLGNINKAEKLIKDVIAEADAGGSPSLVAKGLATAQNAGVAEQVLIQVATEKVGLIIGRGGETIKGLQTRSGARIQLIPEGDETKERTVRVTGNKKQIEIAKEMIKEVMNQTTKPSPFSSGYNQQAYRPRGPTGPPQWGPRGTHSSQPTGDDYQQRGPYHGGSFPQQHAQRSSFSSGWEQRPPTSMQGASPQGGGYDYYGGQRGYVSNHTVSTALSAPIPSNASAHSAPAMGPPPSHANYNYGQPQGPEYGQPAPYSQMGPQHSYGHGYDEPKYKNQASAQHPYGGPQPVYPQGSQPGYAPQQQYGKPPSYGTPAQGLHPQSYGPPRASQLGDMPYQGHVPPQQPHLYSSSGPSQQTYPPHGATLATDGYNQPPPASGHGYPQQGVHSVPGYGQPAGQAAGYAQAGSTGGYATYPSSQVYPEQTAQNNAGYGYQAPQDPNYNVGAAPAYGAAQTGQPGYAQPAPAQPTYDQSAPQSAGYGGVPVTAPANYVKSVSPQPGYPQYDSSQMYGAAPH